MPGAGMPRRRSIPSERPGRALTTSSRFQNSTISLRGTNSERPMITRDQFGGDPIDLSRRTRTARHDPRLHPSHRRFRRPPRRSTGACARGSLRWRRTSPAPAPACAGAHQRDIHEVGRAQTRARDKSARGKIDAARLRRLLHHFAQQHEIQVGIDRPGADRGFELSHDGFARRPFLGAADSTMKLTLPPRSMSRDQLGKTAAMPVSPEQWASRWRNVM